jgi:hypothetical protein
MSSDFFSVLIRDDSSKLIFTYRTTSIAWALVRVDSDIIMNTLGHEWST